MMLATNPSPGLSQFPINLLHNDDDSIHNCNTLKGRSVSPKSADDNGGSATSASSPSTTPALFNNNSISQENNEIKIKIDGNQDAKSSSDNIFENISMMAHGNFWEKQSLMDAAIYAMTGQQMSGRMRSPEMIQQLINQHAILQQQLQPTSTLSALQLRQRGTQQLIGNSATSSNHQQPASIKQELIKLETGQSPDKKRGYPYTFQYCVLCQKNVHSSKLPCHIRQCHVGKPMFQCPACDFTSTYSKNNVKSHMVSLHGITGDPISYMDDYAEQVEEFMKKCFPNVRGRARPFLGRSTNSYSNATNRQIGSSNQKGRQRNSAPSSGASASPQAANEQPSLLSNGSHTSLLLPKFPLFNVLQNGPSLEISVEKSFPEIKEEVAESPVQSYKNENIIERFSPKPNKENREIVPDLGDNDKAIYTMFEHRFVSDSKIKGTVFETFTNSSDLIDRIDLSELAGYFENNNSRLLTASQIKKITTVRKQLPKKDFEIMFALYKCDTSLLTLNQIKLIKTIAPSEVDVRRFQLFCEANSVSNLSDEERFVIELSNTEQLFTRLKVMEMTHAYPDMLFNLQQEINLLTQAALALRQDPLLAIILQCSTIYANFLCGDFGAQLIRGIRVNEAIEVCSYELPNGIKIGKKIADMLPFHGVGDSLVKKINLYTDACQYSFSSLENRVESLSNRMLQLEAERVSLGVDSNNSTTGLVVEEAKLRESLKNAQGQMNETLSFYAERPNPLHHSTHPEDFFQAVVQLLSLLANEL